MVPFNGDMDDLEFANPYKLFCMVKDTSGNFDQEEI
jgi:hypothetical protein